MATKLERLLFLQGGRCFFCRAPLPEPEASVEHLLATANGGANGDENCVVCCKTVNAMLGSMSVKQKMEVLLRHEGKFKCPNGASKPMAATSNPIAPSTSLADDVRLVIANLSQRGAAKPKTVKTLSSTIRSLFQKKIAEERLVAILTQLETDGFIQIALSKVVYRQ